MTGHAIGVVIGKLVGDVMITREEIEGLMANLLYVDAHPVRTISLTGWAKDHAATLGKRYTSEMARRTNRVGGYRSN